MYLTYVGTCRTTLGTLIILPVPYVPLVIRTCTLQSTRNPGRGIIPLGNRKHKGMRPDSRSRCIQQSPDEFKPCLGRTENHFFCHLASLHIFRLYIYDWSLPVVVRI